MFFCKGHPEEQFDKAASGRPLPCRTQRLQYPLIKEYTLNLIWVPIIISGIVLN